MQKKSSGSSGKHTFVTGLARSGTTILLRALYESGNYASLTYDDMPFVMAPNIWANLRGNKNLSAESQERAHGDGILVNTESPEAFEEVFWRTVDADTALTDFESYVNLVLHKYKKSRYLSKNNQNVYRIGQITQIFPAAHVLVPFRDPKQHAQSLLNQHKKFCSIQKEDAFVKDYMDWIGHSEFGLDYKPIVDTALKFPDSFQFDHWLEQWVLVYSMLLENHGDNKNVNFISYEALCGNEKYWAIVKDSIDLQYVEDFEFAQSIKPLAYEYNKALEQQAYELYSRLMKVTYQL